MQRAPRVSPGQLGGWSERGSRIGGCEETRGTRVAAWPGHGRVPRVLIPSGAPRGHRAGASPRQPQLPSGAQTVVLFVGSFARSLRRKSRNEI